MNDNRRVLFISIGIFLSICIVASIFFVRKTFVGDEFYDGIFSSSLSQLPVMKAGRIMPLSSAAADTLKSIGGKSTTKVDGKKVSATKWLWLVNADSEKMSHQPTMRTDNRTLQSLLGAVGRNYPQRAIANHYQALYDSATSGEKTPYTEACANAINSGIVYAVTSRAFATNFADEQSSMKSVKKWNSAVEEAAKEIESSKKEKRDADPKKLVAASKYLKELRNNAEFEDEYKNTSLRSIPVNGEFKTPNEALLIRDRNSETKSAILSYSAIRDCIAKGDFETAKVHVNLLSETSKNWKGVNYLKLKIETYVNALDPFFSGMIMYVFAGMCFALSYIKRINFESKCLGATVLFCAVVLHILAICARMYIQGRPPVTNLYSSVVFTGAVAAAVGLWSYLNRDSITMAFSACLAGALSLLVAVNLPYSGDTMGMMRAVLNSNFWLSVHVVTIMIGYCGVFLAGFAAAMRIIADAFKPNRIRTQIVTEGIYSVLCLALVFSFAGTMLGGIWADMSWGRFWGWDPKENGALMIVLWCAAAIHARAMRFVGDKTFLAMAVFGNIIAAWAWFGVNLMGVGLHAYGFIEGGWGWLLAFVFLQLLIIPFAFFGRRTPKIL